MPDILEQAGGLCRKHGVHELRAYGQGLYLKRGVCGALVKDWIRENRAGRGENFRDNSEIEHYVGMNEGEREMFLKLSRQEAAAENCKRRVTAELDRLDKDYSNKESRLERNEAIYQKTKVTILGNLAKRIINNMDKSALAQLDAIESQRKGHEEEQGKAEEELQRVNQEWNLHLLSRGFTSDEMEWLKRNPTAMSYRGNYEMKNLPGQAAQIISLFAQEGYYYVILDGKDGSVGHSLGVAIDTDDASLMRYRMIDPNTWEYGCAAKGIFDAFFLEYLGLYPEYKKITAQRFQAATYVP